MGVWHNLSGDLRLAIRRLAQARGFTAICLLTLALGIGVTTAVFTLVQQVMLQSLPVSRPTELYRLGDNDNCCVNSGLQGAFSLFSYDLYRHLRDNTPEFSELAAFQAHVVPFSLRRQGRIEAEPFNGQFVSGNYFTMFGLTAARGRLLQADDDRPGSAAVAVISFRAWERHFQSDASLVGQTLAINRVPTTIVGVAPPDFYGDMLRPNPPDVWVPFASEPRMQPQARLIAQPGSHWLYVIGRLRSGTAAPQVDQRLTSLLQQWLRAAGGLSDEERGEIGRQQIRLASAAAGVSNMRDAVAPSLRLLFAIALAVLFIACANLANLLLVRGLRRRAEVGIRVALGAPRPRLIVDAMLESALLACAGGALGLIVAYEGARVFLGLAFRGARYVPINAAPSAAVLAFACGVSLLTGLAFGTVPAFAGSRVDPIEALRGAGRGAGDRSSRLRRGLVSLQVALSLVLVVCAVALAQSLYNLERQDFGFQTPGRYVAGISAALGTAGPDRLQAIYTALPDRLGRIAGVSRIAFSLYSPMEGDNWSSRITVDGHAPAEVLGASWNRVSAGYFETIGTPLLRGRFIDARDTPRSPAVAVVNRRFAKKFFGDGDPIGRRFGFSDPNGGGAHDYEIVGVVGDAKYQDPRGPAYATFFLPFLQHAPNLPAGYDRVEGRSNYAKAIELLVQQPVPNLEVQVRHALAEIDPGLTVLRVDSLEEQVARNFNNERLIATLTVAFGSIALLLACLGLYGVTAQFVAARTREIGVRMAIGASRRRVVASVLRVALRQVAIGCVVGAVAALAAGRWLEAQLYGVSARDPWLLAIGALMLTVCAGVAAVAPAARAASIDPACAMRSE